MIDIDTETALCYGLIALLVIMLLTVIALVLHSGFFSEIVISTCRPYIGEVTIAYKFARGPYKEAGSLFTEAHTLLPHYRTVGVYYDDPRKKDASNLRYIVGLIISENGQEVNKDDEVTLKERGFSFVTFPAIHHVVQTSFPFNSTLSIIVAVIRVYPKLNEYIESRSLCAHPFLEVYDCDAKKIYFIGPLEKQDHFYVPEVKVDDEIKQAEDEDDKSSISWDDSASYIRSDVVDVDSDSIGDDSLSLSNVTSSTAPISSGGPDIQEPEQSVDETEPQIQLHVEAVVANVTEATSAGEDDSDNNTGSSFEEIDEKEAPPSAENMPSLEIPVSSPELKTEL